MSLLFVSRTCTVKEYTPDLFRIGSGMGSGRFTIGQLKYKTQNSLAGVDGAGGSRSARRHAARTSVNRLLTFVGWSLCGA